MLSNKWICGRQDDDDAGLKLTFLSAIAKMNGFFQF